MDLKMLYVVVLFVLVSLTPFETTDNAASWEVKTSSDCPGNSSHGIWSKSEKDGVIRCELMCDGGYEADKCSVLLETGNGTWDREIPNCVEEPWTHTIWGKLVLSVVAGIVAVVAVPLLLCLVGFTCKGVRGGSAAAYVQTPDTEAGSSFARAQSTGAKGCCRIAYLALFIIAFVVTCVLLFVLSGAKC